MAVHWRNSRPKYLSGNDVAALGNPFTWWIATMYELFFERFRPWKSKAWRERCEVSAQLMSDIAFARRNPQYVIADSYTVCLGHRTYWACNYPYCFGREVEAEWLPDFYYKGGVIKTYCAIDFTKPEKPLPSMRTRLALNKFIREYFTSN